MIAVIDDEKVPVTGFNGLFDRGLADTCPQDHLTVCDDCVFPGPNQVQTRKGFDADSTGKTCVQYFQDFAAGAAHDALILDASGNLWSTRKGGALKAFGGSVNGFAAINLYTRIYIVPTVDGRSYGGAQLWFWDGSSNTLTAAGGSKLVANLISANDQTNAGDIDEGIHKYAQVKVYYTGYMTPPSPLEAIDAPGSKNIILTLNDPGADALVEYVYILATKADEEELFFVPGGQLAWQAASATLNFSDTDLVASADYLNDLYETIPGGSSLDFYKGRLIIGGNINNGHTCLVSRVQDPESFDTVDGLVSTEPDASGNTVTAVFGLRDMLLVAKFTGISAFQDNGDVPSTWPITVVEGGYGCYSKGLSTFTSGLPSVDAADQSLIAHKAGLLLFNGSFYSAPLTWKIDTLWQRLNFAAMHMVCVAHDIWNRQVYVNVPLDAETTPTTILVMDYKDGLTPETVKWSVWNPATEPSHVGMMPYKADAGTVYKLWYGSRNQTNFYGLSTSSLTDAGNNQIGSMVGLPLVSLKSGWIHVFTALRMRVKGSGFLNLTIYGEDQSLSATPLGFTLSDPQGNELFRQINFTNEKLQLVLSTTTVLSSWFVLSRAEIFCHPQWMTLPVTPP